MGRPCRAQFPRCLHRCSLRSRPWVHFSIGPQPCSPRATASRGKRQAVACDVSTGDRRQPSSDPDPPAHHGAPSAAPRARRPQTACISAPARRPGRRAGRTGAIDAFRLADRRTRRRRRFPVEGAASVAPLMQKSSYEATVRVLGFRPDARPAAESPRVTPGGGGSRERMKGRSACLRSSSSWSSPLLPTRS
jgi:hypothetical protein